MKTYRMSYGASISHMLEHPERTACRQRSAGWSPGDMEYKVWNARVPMARAIRMQERHESRPGDWCPVVPLSDAEGF